MKSLEMDSSICILWFEYGLTPDSWDPKLEVLGGQKLQVIEVFTDEAFER